MEYNYYGTMGFRVGWHEQGLSPHPKWYEQGWQVAKDKYYSPFAPVINREFAYKFPQFKYSAVTRYEYSDVFQYLRVYEQYPQAEMLVKFGLSQYATSKQILRKIGEDKSFRIDSYRIFCFLIFVRRNRQIPIVIRNVGIIHRIIC